VRFGLRAASDARVQNTVRVIDHLLRDELPGGSVWHRYNGDGYGEHDDGTPFDGTGVGRPWPLLTGERAHYELAAGNTDAAAEMLRTMERFAGPNGLLPEQVWDREDVPERELFKGGPTGSAMPLCWAHAEYLKLAASLPSGRIFDLPAAVEQRFIADPSSPIVDIWDARTPISTIAEGRHLRVQVRTPATIRWTVDDWKTATDTETTPCLGAFHVTLEMGGLGSGGVLEFTTRTGDRWEGVNHRVTVRAVPGTPDTSSIQSSVSTPEKNIG
jgi:glucoamylase